MKAGRFSPKVWGEILGSIGLAALTAFCLSTSWRKWPDPLIDFGRELYIPWRLANGAVLYRDVDDFYGPLSQYCNGALFALFGPGLMVLVLANLLIFIGILVSLYLLIRRAWGVAAALMSSACFISVFGFSHFVTGSFTYAAPYSHEATHGFLVCLLLVIVLLRWLEESTAIRSIVVGGLVGLTLVLKPEIAFAAVLVAATALVIKWRQGGRIWSKGLLFGLLAAVGPTLAFAGYFYRFLPWRTALAMACRAWLSVFASSRYTGDVVQTGFLGLDRPGPHFVEHLRATAGAFMLIVGLGFAGWLVERVVQPLARWLLGAVTLGVIAWLAWFRIDWINSGRCLLGMALIYAMVCAVPLYRRAKESEEHAVKPARLLFAVLSVGLMVRMVLNGRIYQFGFYQAALAGVMIPAILFGDLPGRLKDRWARTLIRTGGFLLLLPGMVLLCASSQRLLRMKTQAVGVGVDRFFAFSSDLEPTGHIVQLVSEQLRQTPPEQTVLVLPEGEMINYLARRASPVAPFFFFSAATSGGREESIVESLEKHPPDWVVIISRDLREYGIRRYGEAPGKGGLIMRWVDVNYQLAGRLGGDPLEATQRGAVILGRR
jgi:hypothetical protein